MRGPGLLALGTGLSITAAAQTAPVETGPENKDRRKDATVLDPVTVTARRAEGYIAGDSSAATKLTLSPRETPQSMTVITRERLDDQELTSMRKVLDNTPGIYSNAYDSERVLFYSRGFLVDSLMYDGVPALSNFNTGSIDETLDTAFYERIEVVRGATGLMTGAGSPAASINLVRKHADSRSPTIAADLTLGSWRDRRVDLDATTPLSADGSIRARAVAVAEDTRSYQALYRKKTYALYGIVDADLAPSTRVSLGVDYQSNQPRANTWGSFPLFLSDGRSANWPRSVTTATDWTFWNRKTQTVFGELRHAFDNGWTLRSTLSHRRYDEDLALFYVFGYPDPVTGLGLDPSAYRSRSTVTQDALDAYASGPIDLLGRRHELVVGYNGSRAKNIGTEQSTVDPVLAPAGNFFAWDGSYPEPAFTPSTPLSDIRTNQDAVYGAARISLAEPLKLIAGARYARWKIDSFYVYDTPENARYSYAKLLPYAGLVWDVLPQFSAFTSFTGIFKPQSSRDAQGHYLDPVDGRSAEVGIKGEHFDHRLNTALTLFETRQRNVAAPVFRCGRTAGAVAGRFERLAADSGAHARLRGRGLGQVSPTGCRARSAGPATSCRTQPVCPRAPSSRGRWCGSSRPGEPGRLAPGLTLGGGINWQSASSTPVGAPEGTPGRSPDTGQVMLTQGSVPQVSLMARYRFSPKLSLQVNANNLLDRKYDVLDQYDTLLRRPRELRADASDVVLSPRADRPDRVETMTPVGAPRSTASMRASRTQIVSRVGAGLVGGWVFVWGFATLAIALLLATGMSYEDARTLAYLLAFPLYVVVLCASFAARRAARVWLVLAGGGAAMTALAWSLTRWRPDRKTPCSPPSASR